MTGFTPLNSRVERVNTVFSWELGNTVSLLLLQIDYPFKLPATVLGRRPNLEEVRKEGFSLLNDLGVALAFLIGFKRCSHRHMESLTSRCPVDHICV